MKSRMSLSVSVKFSKLFAGCVYFFVLSGSVWADQPAQKRPATEAKTLIFSNAKDYDAYELIVGKIDYLEDDQGEGYRPAKTERVVGSISRHIYDYPKTKSAIEIDALLRNQFFRDGYKTVYQCVGDACGGAPGWRLYLSEKLRGVDKSQFYHAMIKRNKNGSKSYAIYYVNDIGRQPRALMDIVMIKADSNGNVDAHATNNADIVSLYFDASAFAVDNRKNQLERLKSFITNNKSGCAFDIIGFADVSGDESANQTLSAKRVQSVVDYLSQTVGLSSGCLTPLPRGEDIAAENTGNFERQRRVDVVVGHKS